MRAYCLNRAVWLLGSTIDIDLENATRNCKTDKDMTRARQRVIDMWFPKKQQAAGRFADPAKMF